MGRLGNFCMRAMAGLATTSMKQLLALERLLPVPRHGLYGLTATQASQLMQEQANTVGLLHWCEGHFDHVWPFALLPHQYRLFLACSLLNLRVLPAAVNMQRGSGGVSLVQSRWGTPLWGQLRRLPNGELLDLGTSRQVGVAACWGPCLASAWGQQRQGPCSAATNLHWLQILDAMRAEAAQHSAYMFGRITAVEPGPCPCGPCRVVCAPDQPLETQEQADEVEQQQSWHLWSIACACLRDAIGVQLWQIGRHLRHGGTGLPEVSVPLLPPADGSGAGLDKQLAGRIAHRAVGLYLDRAATDRAHAGLPQLPSELTSDVQRQLQHRLYELLVAPPAGPQEQEEEEQAEEEREVAWAAEVDGEAVQEQAQRQQQTRRQLVEEARRRLLEEARQQMGARRLATGHLPVLEQIRLQEEAWEQVLEQRRLEEACHAQKRRKLWH